MDCKGSESKLDDGNKAVSAGDETSKISHKMGKLALSAESKSSGGSPSRQTKDSFGVDDAESKGVSSEDVAKGLKLLEMSMRDSNSGTMLWRSTSFHDDSTASRDILSKCFGDEMSERVPTKILDCRAISREILFSSSHAIQNFHLEQKVIFHGQCIESWKFHFGFVIPDSTNSWQQIIEAAAKDKMLPAEQLSGNVVFETAFYDGQDLLCTNSVRMFYVD